MTQRDGNGRFSRLYDEPLNKFVKLELPEDHLRVVLIAADMRDQTRSGFIRGCINTYSDELTDRYRGDTGRLVLNQRCDEQLRESFQRGYRSVIFPIRLTDSQYRTITSRADSMRITRRAFVIGCVYWHFKMI